ncbi:MAG TPA: MBL fold metallo-hydrolase [Pyrinomonadaceae bacterium]|jgi:L-ascorbate metabolism protein UlaG (beta-lactamase superfamily)|nr:MBL fold metallo-hydrolase [Pyrinomonadaceae bacterium]
MVYDEHDTHTAGKLGRRGFLQLGGGALLAAALTDAAASSVIMSAGEGEDLKIQRLSWAGLKLVSGESTVFIDPWVSPETLNGAWKDPIVPIQVETQTRAVLITHLHNDHFDPKAISSVFEKSPGVVVCHTKVADTVASRGFRVRSLDMYEPLVLGDFTVAPVPAADGFGEYQVSWVVTAGGRRVIHCGDTLWHGGWWKTGRQYGPFDAAFLPINGVVIKEGAQEPASDLPVVMTAEQAVAAGIVLGAKLVIPIHYGVRDPASYVEDPKAESSLLEIARRREQAVELVKPGDWVKWRPSA